MNTLSLKENWTRPEVTTLSINTQTDAVVNVFLDAGIYQS